MRFIRTIPLVLLLAMHGSSDAQALQAQPQTAPVFRLGNAEIVVPWPDGYMDIAVAEPSIAARGLVRDRPNVRYVAQYMSADLLAASPEEAAGAASSDFFALQVDRKAERSSATQQEFDSLRHALEITYGLGAKLDERIVAADMPRAEKLLSERSHTDVKINLVGRPRASVDVQQPNFVQFTFSYRISAVAFGKRTLLDVVTSTGALFIKGQIVMLRRLRLGPGGDEMDFARKGLSGWATQVLASNLEAPIRWRCSASSGLSPTSAYRIHVASVAAHVVRIEVL